MCNAEDAENAKEPQYIGENTEEKRIHALVRWMTLYYMYSRLNLDMMK